MMKTECLLKVSIFLLPLMYTPRDMSAGEVGAAT